nr:es2 protein [Hymenolepis microstoma]
MNNSGVVTSGDGSKQLVTYSKVQQKIVRQNVRSEEEYLNHIGKIIQRDFFPDIAELSGETPGDPVIDASQTPSGPPTQNPQRDEISMRLDKYLANNTTEDNASFIEIIEESERKREAKLANFFPSRSPTNALTADAPSLAIEPGPSSSNQIVVASSVVKSPITSSVKSLTSHNSVHFNPDGAPLTAQELTEHFNRERRICPENSRFKIPLGPVKDRRKFVNPAAANRVGRFGIDGKEIVGNESPMSTPNVGGFRFIDSNPSATPFSAGGGATPLMTWGEMESTPYRLDEASGHTPLVSSFRLPSPSKREALAHELADKVGRQRAKGRADAMKLAKSAAGLGLLSPQAAAMAKIALSPAARRLLSRTSSGASLAFGGRPNSSVRSSGLSSTPKRLPSDIGVIRRPPTVTSKTPQTPRPDSRDVDPDVSNPADLTNDLLDLTGSKSATTPE